MVATMKTRFVYFILFSIFVHGYDFFINNPIFRLSFKLLSGLPKMTLKVAMKLQKIFSNRGSRLLNLRPF